MNFPKEIVPDLISYLKMLERKGIRSLYLGKSASSHGKRGGRTGVDKSASSGLADLTERVRVCVDCSLHKTRKNTVFGVGNPRAQLMFVGEAPGREEDLKGEPFVGRAGQLLTNVFQAIGLRREDVFITNILKCRPPENRDPVESEVRCCEKYLISQIELIRPRLICALGRISAQWLLGTRAPLSMLRQGEYDYQGIRVLVTYHPAALLRQPHLKKEAWEDFKRLEAMLGES